MSIEKGFAIEARGLSYGFRSGFWLKRKAVIHHIDMEIPEGQVFGLLGMNGAGKTTLIHLITGLRAPIQGQVNVFGFKADSLEARRLIGFLPERPYFHDYLTGDQFLRFHARLSGLDPHIEGERVKEVLQQVKMWGAKDKDLKTYSKGMLQRIGIAQALIHDPKVLILDEPMSGLDPIARREMRQLIIELGITGHTVLLTSHVISDIEEVCSHVAILRNGSILEKGPIEEFLVHGKLEEGIARWYKGESTDEL